MALELNKLTKDVNALGQNLAERLAALAEQLPAAQSALNDIGVADEALLRKVEAARQHRWAGAIPTAEAVGEAFLIAGPRYVSQDELAGLIARSTGGRVWPFHIPAGPIQLLGDLVEALSVPLGLEPPIHRRRVDFWTKSRAFTIEKARRLLGYVPKVDVEEGIARTAAWYREAGWL